MRIGILQAPDFHPNIALGGSQRIILLLLDQFVDYFSEIYLFHGYKGSSYKIKMHKGFISIPLFSITQELLTNGIIKKHQLNHNSRYMSNLDVLICFDRCIEDLSIKQLVTISATDYSFVKDIITSNYPEEIIVPSEFVKNKIEKSRETQKPIRVIPNGIKLNECGFEKKVSTSNFSILFPHRPDPRKGFNLLPPICKELNANSKYKTYTFIIPKQEGFEVGENVYLDIENRFRQSQCDEFLKFVKWKPTNDLQLLYAESNLTLCPGDLEEGFGLTVLESILNDVPVIARPFGNIPHLLPDSHGCFILRNSSISNICNTIDQVLSSDTLIELNMGKEYIKENYPVEKMTGEFIDAIEEYA